MCPSLKWAGLQLYSLNKRSPLQTEMGFETYQERSFHEISLFGCWCSLGLVWGCSRLEGHTVCVAGNQLRPRDIRPALGDLLSLVFCITLPQKINPSKCLKLKYKTNYHDNTFCSLINNVVKRQQNRS